MTNILKADPPLSLIKHKGKECKLIEESVPGNRCRMAEAQNDFSMNDFKSRLAHKFGDSNPASFFEDASGTTD
jgi:hypothetical protein